MSTRAQQAQLLTNTTFQQQVTGALIAAATNVINEAATTVNHQNRVAWANAIIASPTQQMQFFLPGMLTNPTVAGNAGAATLTASGTVVLDTDCDYVVASLYDKYANQFALQQNFGAALQLGH